MTRTPGMAALPLMFAVVVFLALLVGCAAGSARLDEQGKPTVSGWVLGDAQIRICEARDDGEPMCAEIRGGTLSEGAKGWLDRFMGLARGVLGLVL